jgi:hypothetical protein
LVPSGSWVATGDLAQPRAGAAAALLADGVVLVSGGSDGTAPTATTDRYNAFGGTFATASPMHTARASHTATRLDDGRVLVVGGVGADGAMLASAELYDPYADTWTVVGNLANPRAGHTATLLPDGNVLIAGGDSASGPLATLEVYSQIAGGFLPTAGQMSSPRARHAAALAGDKVWIIGGWDGTAQLGSVDVYDPETGSLTSGPSMGIDRAEHSATTLLDGNVLVVGGMSAGGELLSAEVLDLAAGQFVPTPTSLAAPRRNHLALLLPHNNSVLITGGWSGEGAAASSELFRAWQDGGRFLATGTLGVARNWGAGSALSFPASATNRSGPADGIAIVAGGTGAAGAELYGFATVKTDREDYSPGMTVRVSGSGWQPNQPVTFFVRELPAEHYAQLFTIPADGAGNIDWTDLFPVEEHHGGVRFLLLAGDGISQAHTTFTDAVGLQGVSASPASRSVTAGTSTSYLVTVDFNGSGTTGCHATLSVSGLPVGATATWDTSNTAPSNGADVTRTLNIATTLPAAEAILTIQAVAPDVSGGQGCNGATRSTTVRLTVTAPAAAPVVNRDNASVNVDEGQTAHNTGTWSDANAGDTVTLSASVGTVIKSGPNSGGTWSWSYPTTDGPANSQTVTITANDGAGGVSTTTFALTVANVAPTVATPVVVPEPSDEGSAATASATFSDPGVNDAPFSCTVNYGDGSGALPGVVSGTTCTGPSHTYADDGAFMVTVAVTDKDGDSGSSSSTHQVNNLLPSISAVTNDGPVNEGSPALISVTASDPGVNDTLSYEFDCDNDGSYEVGPQAGSTNACTFGDNGIYVVNVRVTDDDGAAATGMTSVTVSNVAPTVAAGADATINEGATFNQNGSFTDPGTLDTWTATVDYGDGSGVQPLTLTGQTFALSHTYADNGIYTVTVTVTDDDGGPGSDTVQVTVNNVAPTVDAGAGATIDEGALFSQSGSFTDPGTLDTWTATVDYGDGSGVQALALTGQTFALSHTYADNGIYTVTVMVTDDDGGPGSDTVQVTVNNVAPTAALSNNGPVNEGSPATVSFTGQFDPSTADTTAGFHYAFACDNGSLTSATYSGSGTSASMNCTFGDNGTFTVRARIIDKDDGYTEYTTTVTVDNVAPTNTFSAFSFNPYNGMASASISFSDPGWRDLISSGFNWAGVLKVYGPIGPATGPGPITGSFTSTHTFGPGCITDAIEVVVSDDDGASFGHQFAAADTLGLYSVAFLAPLKDGARNVVKLGNVIPVKLSIRDCSGNSLTNKTLSIWVTAGILNPEDVTNTTDLVTANSVSSADTTGFMRLADGQYMYNLATKGLTTGLPYTIVIKDGALVVATAVIEAKK